MRRRSLKMQAAYRRRIPLLKAYLEEHEMCERCGLAASVDVHEKQKRSRNPHALLDPRLWAGLCRSCHDWTEREPAQATAEGWLIPSWVDIDDEGAA